MDSSILIVLAILAGTVFMLVLDVVRIDVVAILSMLALAWSGVLAPHEALSGFSSNAVVAMMAVMIMGRGVARTGLMDGFSRAVVKLAGAKKSKIVGLISVPVGLMSGLIQNIGAVALFLPGSSRYCASRKDRAVGLDHAHRVCCYSRRHPEHGGLGTADPVERPAARCGPGALWLVERDTRGSGAAGSGDQLFYPVRALCFARQAKDGAQTVRAGETH
jgi:hypothetical protein